VNDLYLYLYPPTAPAGKRRAMKLPHENKGWLAVRQPILTESSRCAVVKFRLVNDVISDVIVDINITFLIVVSAVVLTAVCTQQTDTLRNGALSSFTCRNANDTVPTT